MKVVGKVVAGGIWDSEETESAASQWMPFGKKMVFIKGQGDPVNLKSWGKIISFYKVPSRICLETRKLGFATRLHLI